MKAGVDNRTTWQILTDYELKNTDPSIIHNSFRDPGPYDINNLCSFNDNLKHNDMCSIVFDGNNAKKDIHVIFKICIQ